MAGSDRESLGEEFVRRFSGQYSVSVMSKKLAKGLTQFIISPANKSASPLRITVSSSAIIVNFARGQIELPSLPVSEVRLTNIANAIAHGRLVATNRKWLGRYQLTLDNGTILRGGSIRGIPLGRRAQTFESWGRDGL
jgi:hypothetical protein